MDLSVIIPIAQKLIITVLHTWYSGKVIQVMFQENS